MMEAQNNAKSPDQTQIAIESIGKSGSLAVMSAGNVLWDRQFSEDQRAASQMAVQLREALNWCQANGETVRWISTAVGPGSFTGLRIGITTAKTLGYAMSLPIVPVGSLSAIAASAIESIRRVQTTHANPSVLVGLNAYRGQVFMADFKFDELESVTKEISHRATLISREQWNARLEADDGDEKLITTGDEALFSLAPGRHVASQTPDAVGVGRIAASLMVNEMPESVYVDAFALAANYLKQSAAEEKAKASPRS